MWCIVVDAMLVSVKAERGGRGAPGRDQWMEIAFAVHTSLKTVRGSLGSEPSSGAIWASWAWAANALGHNVYKRVHDMLVQFHLGHDKNQSVRSRLNF